MKMRLILLLPLALLALKGNLNAASIVNYGTDGDDTQIDLGTAERRHHPAVRQKRERHTVCGCPRCE